MTWSARGCSTSCVTSHTCRRKLRQSLLQIRVCASLRGSENSEPEPWERACFIQSIHRVSVFRAEVVPGTAAPSFLSSGSVGPVAAPARLSVLADAAPEALAYCQPGTPAVHLLWTSAARGWRFLQLSVAVCMEPKKKAKLPHGFINCVPTFLNSDE